MRCHFLIAYAASLLVIASGAQAQGNWPNWYVGLVGELTFVQEGDANIDGSQIGEIDFDTGYAFGGSLGFRPYVSGSFLDNMRFEVELIRRGSDFEDLTFAGVAVPVADGELNSNALFFNALYDFDTGFRWQPYIGVGVGFLDMEFESQALNADDNDTVFAYQGMVGMSTSFFGLPYSRFGVGYRYVGSSDPDITTQAGQRLEYEFDSHSLEGNMRFFF